MKRWLGLILLGAVLGVLSWPAPKAEAYANTPPIDDAYNSRLIDDSIFLAHTMSAQDIQNFLNSKVPVCDTNHQGGLAQYPPPYICLKDYVDPVTGKRAAQLIYDEATAVGLNPQVILVTLQKEQGLVTDTWPYPSQYQSAMGYGCPESLNVCQSQYYGLYNQVHLAAQFLRAKQARACNDYATLPSWGDIPAELHVGHTTDPNASTHRVDSVGTYIGSCATGALYYYTPHRPDSAYTLRNGSYYYGNYHFVNYFTSWFGPPISGDTYFAVTDTNPDNGLNIWYLVTPNGRYMIPSLEVYYAWGLDRYQFQTISRSYFDSLPDGGTLGRELKDRYNNYFFVDNAQTHFVRDPSYLSLWGLAGSSVVSNTGLVYALSGGTWVGRFMQDISTNQLWLMDGGTKHAIASNSPLLYQWGFTPDQLTKVTSTYADSLPDGGSLSRYVQAGSNAFLLDSGRAVALSTPEQRVAFGAGSPLGLASSASLNYTPAVAAKTLVEDSGRGGWYLLDGGKKHYVPSLNMALNWGYQRGTALLKLSSDYLDGLADGGALRYLVKDGGGAVWAVDGRRHAVTGAQVNDWTTDSSALPVYDATTLALLADGGAVGRFIRPSTAQFVYELEGGVKHYLQGPSVERAWATPGNTTALNASLVDLVPEASSLTMFVKTGAGNEYLLDNGTAYSIPSAYKANWETAAPALISDAKFASLGTGTTLGVAMQVGPALFLMSNGQAVPVVRYQDAYGSLGATPLTYNPYATAAEASYLVGSTDDSDSRLWLINGGKKVLFPSFAEAANYGYISQGVAVTRLAPSVLSAIPNSSDVPSLLIRKDGAGIKLLSFGSALGFPDGATLTSYQSASNPITTLAASIYDGFVLRRTASRLITDDAHHAYWMENGTKRLITNPTLLSTTYAGIPSVYLEGTTMVDLPNGVDLN